MSKNNLEGLTRIGHLIAVDGNLIPASVVEASSEEVGLIFDLPEEQAPQGFKEKTPAEVRNAGKYSPEAQEFIGNKIKKLKEEGKSQEQAEAQAINMARDKGLKVPPKP